MNCNICTDKKKKKEQASTVSFDMCLIWANRLFHILAFLVYWRNAWVYASPETPSKQ